MPLKKGHIVDVHIEDVAFKGKGVAKVDDLVIFVPRAIPGDHCQIRIVKKKSSYAEGKILSLLSPSQDRVEATCGHAHECGGCTWQHVDMDAQRNAKTKIVQDSIQRTAGLDPTIVQPIIGGEEHLGYRNKMEYSFGDRRWLSDEEIASGKPIESHGIFAGLHAPGRFDRILNLQECHLQSSPSWNIVDAVRSWCQSHDIPAWSPVKQTGWMKHCLIRKGEMTNQWLVNLVTASEDISIMEPLKEHLLATFPEITTLVWTINDSTGPTKLHHKELILHGPGYIEEVLGDIRFRIRPMTFFQTNSRQARVLYDVAKELVEQSRSQLGNKPIQTLLDLYCGIGSISQYMHHLAQQCVGIELNEQSVQEAKENAKRNQISNVSYVAGDALDLTKREDWQATVGTPDVIITDPPRAGMHPNLVTFLKERPSPVMVYISCDPMTLARDLAQLKETYEIRSIQPVDMFPQTYHIENVCLLHRKTSS
jgi:23S rRNA (uracil1939-C5)-methyltransferase